MGETLILIAVFGVLAWLADRWTEWARRHQPPTCTVVACADPDCSCRRAVTDIPSTVAASPDEIAEARERRARHEDRVRRATGGGGR